MYTIRYKDIKDIHEKINNATTRLSLEIKTENKSLILRRMNEDRKFTLWDNINRNDLLINGQKSQNQERLDETSCLKYLKEKFQDDQICNLIEKHYDAHLRSFVQELVKKLIGRAATQVAIEESNLFKKDDKVFLDVNVNINLPDDGGSPLYMLGPITCRMQLTKEGFIFDSIRANNTLKYNLIVNPQLVKEDIRERANAACAEEEFGDKLDELFPNNPYSDLLKEAFENLILAQSKRDILATRTVGHIYELAYKSSEVFKILNSECQENAGNNNEALDPIFETYVIHFKDRLEREENLEVSRIAREEDLWLDKIYELNQALQQLKVQRDSNDINILKSFGQKLYDKISKKILNDLGKLSYDQIDVLKETAKQTADILEKWPDINETDDEKRFEFSKEMEDYSNKLIPRVKKAFGSPNDAYFETTMLAIVAAGLITLAVAMVVTSIVLSGGITMAACAGAILSFFGAASIYEAHRHRKEGNAMLASSMKPIPHFWEKHRKGCNKQEANEPDPIENNCK